MIELFSFDFMQRAFLVGMIVAIVAPTIGLFFVVRRYSTMADTLAHISLAGVAVSLIAGTAAIPTALFVSVCSVLGIERLREKKVLPPDTIVSLFLFGGLAVGVVLLGLSTGKNVNIVNYLFGNILTVTNQNIVSVGLIALISLIATFVFRRQLFAISLDEETAEANGISVKLYNRILAILGAATIAISLNVVGVLLIGAMMVIPVLTAMQFRLGFQKTWVISIIVSIVSVVSGLIISYFWNLASGGTIVLCSIGLFVIATFFSHDRFIPEEKKHIKI